MIDILTKKDGRGAQEDLAKSSGGLPILASFHSAAKPVPCVLPAFCEFPTGPQFSRAPQWWRPGRGPRPGAVRRWRGASRRRRGRINRWKRCACRPPAARWAPRKGSVLPSRSCSGCDSPPPGAASAAGVAPSPPVQAPARSGDYLSGLPCKADRAQLSARLQPGRYGCCRRATPPKWCCL